MASLLGLLSELTSSGRVLGAAGVLLVIFFIVDVANRPSYPDSIPRVGFGTGFVASVRNYFLAYVRHKAWVAEGYEKVRPRIRIRQRKTTAHGSLISFSIQNMTSHLLSHRE